MKPEAPSDSPNRAGVVHKKYDVPHIILEFGSLDDLPKQKNLRLDLSITAGRTLDTPVEFRIYSPDEVPATTSNDLILYGAPRNIGPGNYGGDDYFKGYWSLISAAMAEVCRREDLFERSYDFLLDEIIREGNGTTAGTYQLLKKMMEELPPHVFIEWFRHDSHTPQWLRRSTPFIWIVRSEYKPLLEEVLEDIVEHPEQYPPLPAYQEWLRRQLAKGKTGEPMLRYIPKHLHSEFEEIVRIPEEALKRMTMLGYRID